MNAGPFEARFCPNCKGEYADTIEQCESCVQPLIPGSSPRFDPVTPGWLELVPVGAAFLAGSFIALVAAVYVQEHVFGRPSSLQITFAAAAAGALTLVIERARRARRTEGERQRRVTRALAVPAPTPDGIEERYTIEPSRLRLGLGFMVGLAGVGTAWFGIGGGRPELIAISALVLLVAWILVKRGASSSVLVLTGDGLRWEHKSLLKSQRAELAREDLRATAKRGELVLTNSARTGEIVTLKLRREAFPEFPGLIERVSHWSAPDSRQD